jgi:peptidoglycan/LPS O-acetylase OafA/YrhL
MAAAPPAPAPRIDPGLSVLLDLLRIGAALAVMFGHLTSQWLLGGHLWFLGGYQHGAVMVFFVLSGFVIAATTNSEAGARAYAAARLSRLWSAALPALALTLLLDAAGRAVDVDHYLVDAPLDCGRYVAEANGWRALLNALFVHEWWLFGLAPSWPGSNVPFWSLSFEAAYYAGFGLAVFLRGMPRVAALVLLAALAGPRILVFAPVWLTGVLIWRVRHRIPRQLGWPLVLAGALLLLAFGWNVRALEALDRLVPYLGKDMLLSRYTAGLAAACLVAGLAALPPLRLPSGIARTVRAAADHSFELYLVHVPVALFVAAIVPAPAGDPLRTAAVFAGVAAATFALARVATPLKPRMRRALAGGASR